VSRGCAGASVSKSTIAFPRRWIRPADSTTKEDGVIEAKSELGQILLEGLKLDHPELTYQRKLVLGVVRLAEERNHVALLVGLLGYPDDLPNLRRKRPPGGNARPGGIAASWREQRRRGALAAVY
jgi:hypothetical protein